MKKYQDGVFKFSSREWRRVQIWNKTQGVCIYCGEQTFWIHKIPEPKRHDVDVFSKQFTVDHVIPHCLGTHYSVNELNNQVAACFDCNESKGDKIPCLVV